MDKLDELLTEIAPLPTGSRQRASSKREALRRKSEDYAAALEQRARVRKLVDESEAAMDALRFRRWFAGRDGKSIETWRRIVDATPTKHRA